MWQPFPFITEKELAGFLAGYMETGDYEKALKLGVYAGSATAFSEGLAHKEEIMVYQNDVIDS